MIKGNNVLANLLLAVAVVASLNFGLVNFAAAQSGTDWTEPGSVPLGGAAGTAGAGSTNENSAAGSGAAVNPSTGASLELKNPLKGIDTIEQLIGRLLRPVFGIVGSLALVMFVYGGFMWMTSAGSSEKLKKGRETLVWAAIGLFVVMSSYTLVTITINTITSAN